ncbi:MBL fold metallo-hydrolase [Halobacillus shinanisalinarum]|uniref:MBL fold metallo-hydrolase n=1 Tax=Halobacillus shinanisalinarum TaxID=2932258 RepID=A0ABY4H316_9BACI|nr:MBL fold metallo-hydrolase [Halobacillus shinanisalinarum]UOQ94714.1 MBL fold metallo-hydrolase [Halobacillus shinanisalinarum]
MIESQTTPLKFYPISVPTQGSLKTVNFYLLLIKDQLLLFDAGWTGDSYWQALKQTLKENQFELEDISGIVLSHHHIDHCGLVNHIIEQHDIPVYAHKKAFPRLQREETFLRERIQFFEALYGKFDCRDRGEDQVEYLKRSLEKNRHLAVKANLLPIEEAPLNGLDALHFPGHAPDQIGLWEQTKGILFGADVLIQHISSNALVEPNESGERLPTLHQSVESLKTIASLPVQLIYSGHGSVIRDPQALVKKRLDRIDQKGDKIISLIEKGASTGKEIAQSYYGSTYDQQFSLVMSEIIGQLDYLEIQGKIDKSIKDGIYHYSPVI